MTKIEVMQSQDSQQAQVEVAIDKLIDYINNYTKQEIEDALEKMRVRYRSSYYDVKTDNIVIPAQLQAMPVEELTLDNAEVHYQDADKYDTDTDENDFVNHPSYYADGKIEVIDYIEDKELDYHLGTAVKYISRAGKKHEQGMTDKEKEIQDLQKAVWFINRKIKLLKNED